MVKLNAVQERNLRAALSVTDDQAQLLRLAFAVWSESSGLIYANDGRNTSRSQGVTPEVAAILRRSLELPHDAVGSNGRSTGMLQQLSSDVGGAWGDMAGTMDPATSARRFLQRLRVTDNSRYEGRLQTSTGSRPVTVQLSDPIAADVLRVQQPLAAEAESTNYGPEAVRIAREIVQQIRGTTPAAPPAQDWLTMATKDELADLVAEAAKASNATLVVKDNDSGWHYSIAPRHFVAVNDQQLSHGRGTGLLRVSPQALNWIQLCELRAWAFGNNADALEAAKVSGEASSVWHDGGKFA